MTQISAVNYLEKAERALRAAQLLLREGWTEGACNRAYYAMHDAAHASLISVAEETPGNLIKTHHTLIAAFGKKMVQGGLIDASLGRAFNKVHDTRQLADYTAEAPALADASWAVEQAEVFVTTIRNLLFTSVSK